MWKGALADKERQTESIDKWLNFGAEIFKTIRTGEPLFDEHHSSLCNLDFSTISHLDVKPFPSIESNERLDPVVKRLNEQSIDEQTVIESDDEVFSEANLTLLEVDAQRSVDRLNDSERMFRGNIATDKSATETAVSTSDNARFSNELFSRDANPFNGNGEKLLPKRMTGSGKENECKKVMSVDKRNGPKRNVSRTRYPKGDQTNYTRYSFDRIGPNPNNMRVNSKKPQNRQARINRTPYRNGHRGNNATSGRFPEYNNGRKFV